MTAPPPAFDVAVIGLGPVGAVAAALLGQAGLRVLVADKSHTLYDKPRAVGMDHEVMRVLQNLGLAAEVEPLTAPFKVSEHYGADGRLIRRVGMLDPPFPLAWTPTMSFNQPGLETLLRQHLGTLPAVTVALGHTLTALQQDAHGVRFQFTDDTGATREQSARWLIGCDGASSTVRRLCAMTRDDLGFDEPWLVIDLLAKDSGLPKLPAVGTHFCDPARPTMYVLCSGRHRRFEMMLLPGEDPAEMEREERVWALLSRWITPADATLWRRASYRFHAVVGREWRRGNVFLAGDAAHQQPPFLGQGMCQGIRDAVNLAWKLRMVHAGEATDALLDTYEAERSPHVRTLIGIVKDIGRTICELDPQAAQARDERLRAESGGEIRTLVRQQLMPALSHGLLGEREHPARGTLLPQPFVLQGAGAARLDDVAGGGWRVVLGDAALGWPVEWPPGLAFARALRIASAQPVVAPALQERDGLLADWLLRHGAKAAIVRPDHCVYALCDNAAQLRDDLARLARRLQDQPASRSPAAAA